MLLLTFRSIVRLFSSTLSDKTFSIVSCYTIDTFMILTTLLFRACSKTSRMNNMNMEALENFVIDLYVTGRTACVYNDENDDKRTLGNVSRAEVVIDLGNESWGGWTARVIRYLRGDYLVD